ncbi:MAG: agmatinase [Thaumarchaeota archaeon S14]|nr:MAG: agmatinase [Thaumarchaeota archaeon S14]
MSYLDLYSGGGPLLESGNGEARAAVFGVPFDSTHSYRPGTRFGPDAIREAFNNIEVFHAGLGVDLEGVRIADHGNLRHTVVASEMLEMVGRATAELAGRGMPAVILGGEHLLTLGSAAQFGADTAFVVFDAHYDLRDSYAGARESHASYLRRLVERRGAGGIVHVGARAFAGEELAFLSESGIRTVSDAEVRAGEGPRALERALEPYGRVYASFDLDALDPAYAPGVGNPEADGMTSRELFGMLGALREKEIACADIVELNPGHDSGATAALAAKIMSTVIAMQVAHGGL